MIAISAVVLASALYLPSTHPNVSYLGRFMQVPSGARCAWTHSTVRLAFTGTSVNGSLQGGDACNLCDGSTLPLCGDRFAVYVDGSLHGKPFRATNEGMISYVLADRLTDAPHTLELIRLTEDNTLTGARIADPFTSGASTFGGFSLNPGATTRKWELNQKTPPLRLHFIGDSDTAGWCADGLPGAEHHIVNASKHHCPNELENSAEAWAARVAAALGADTELVATAVTGAGVRGFPIQQYLDWVLPRHTYGHTSEKYKWEEFAPDAVVILLGANDKVAKNDTGFVADYAGLLTMLAARYAYMGARGGEPTRFISVGGGSSNGLTPELTAGILAAHAKYEAEARENASKTPGAPAPPKAYYTEPGNATWWEINKDPSVYKGCNGHYSPKGHQVLADAVIADIKRFLDVQ